MSIFRHATGFVQMGHKYDSKIFLSKVATMSDYFKYFKLTSMLFKKKKQEQLQKVLANQLLYDMQEQLTSKLIVTG